MAALCGNGKCAKTGGQRAVHPGVGFHGPERKAARREAGKRDEAMGTQTDMLSRPLINTV